MRNYVVIGGCGFRPYPHGTRWVSELTAHQEPKLLELLEDEEMMCFNPVLESWGDRHQEPHLFLSETVSELAYVPDEIEVEYQWIRSGILTIRFDGKPVYPPEIQKRVKMTKQQIARLFKRGGSELAGKEIRERLLKVVHGFDPGIPMKHGIINKCVAEVAGISPETSRSRVNRMEEKGEIDFDLLFRPSAWTMNGAEKPVNTGPYNENWPDDMEDTPRWRPGDPWPEKKWECRKPEIRLHAV